MRKFTIKIDVEALEDIQKTIEWYDSIKIGLGSKFQNQVVSQISKLTKNPYLFSIRYENNRCFLIKKFPFLVHYSIDEVNCIIEIFALFHTSRNPQIWTARKEK
jgi:hypothetical protein